MGRCSKCHATVDLPFKCRRCGKQFCGSHRLPEDHNCPKLQKGNVFKNLNHRPARTRHHRSTTRTAGKKSSHTPVKRTFLQKIKYKLSRRSKRPFNRWKGLYKSLFALIVVSVLLVAIYQHLDSLNEITIWFLRLGSSLLIVGIYYWFKYGYKLYLRLEQLYLRSKRWKQYVFWIVILFVVLYLIFGNVNYENTIDKVKNESIGEKISPFKPGSLRNFSEGVDRALSIESEQEPREDISIPELEFRIHELINQERRNNGLSPLNFDNEIRDIARDHSQDMAIQNYFDHISPTGQDPTDRGNRAGYRCRKDYGSYYTEGLAENIFQNNLYSSVTYINGIPIYNWLTLEEIAQSTVQGWMNSPGHRQNILTPEYDREGIGVYIGGNEEVMITQNFC